MMHMACLSAVREQQVRGLYLEPPRQLHRPLAAQGMMLPAAQSSSPTQRSRSLYQQCCKAATCIYMCAVQLSVMQLTGADTSTATGQIDQEMSEKQTRRHVASVAASDGPCTSDTMLWISSSCTWLSGSTERACTVALAAAAAEMATAAVAELPDAAARVPARMQTAKLSYTSLHHEVRQSRGFIRQNCLPILRGLPKLPTWSVLSSLRLASAPVKHSQSCHSRTTTQRSAPADMHADLT